VTFTTADVMTRAATTIGDEQFVRWSAQELHRYLNDGLRAIVAIKPNAKSKTVTLDLVEGTMQTLPEDYTILSRVSRNITSDGNGTGAIRTLDSRSVVDAMLPGWQDETVIPFARVVKHVIHDLADPATFYVVPGNDATGHIEAVVGAYPAASPVPGANPSAIGSYTDAVDLADIYLNPLVDYLIHRAYAKDARVAGSAARAAAHYEMFTGGVVGFASSENKMALATHASTIQQARES
jgi:hypothetical protein